MELSEELRRERRWLGVAYDMATASTVIWIIEEVEAFGNAFCFAGIFCVDGELCACRTWA